MPLLVKNGEIVTADQRYKADIYCAGETITAIGPNLPAPDGAEVIDASGKLIFDAAFPAPDMSYRAYVQPWVGKPLYPPSGAARARSGRTTVYASWNGATQVSAWRVLAVTAAGAIQPVATHTRTGFETSIPVSGGSGRFEVQAIDAAKTN